MIDYLRTWTPEDRQKLLEAIAKTRALDKARAVGPGRDADTEARYAAAHKEYVDFLTRMGMTWVEIAESALKESLA